MSFAKRNQSLEAVELASENYMKVKSQLDTKRDLLIDACHTASLMGASHREIAIRTPYTRQRISQFLAEGETYAGEDRLG